MAADLVWEQILDQHDSDDAFVVVIDDQFILRAASPPIWAETDVEPRQAIGLSATDLIHPDDFLRALDIVRETTAADGLRSPNLYRVRWRLDGSYRTFGITAETLLDGTATVIRLSDPTEQTRSQLIALEQIDIFEMMGHGRSLPDCLLALVIMVERNSDGARAIIHLSDDEHRLQPVSSGSLPRSVLERFGGAPAEAPGGALQHALLDRPPDVIRSGIPGYPGISASVARRADGTIAGYLELLHSSSKRAETNGFATQQLVCRLIGLLADRFAVEPRATEALLDGITGLPNRQALERTAEDLDDRRPDYGLLAIDLDNFSIINTSNPEAGERFLVAAAQAIRSVLPDKATAFRSGDDEFVIVVPGERRADALAALGQRILKVLDAHPIDLGSDQRTVSVSIGASTASGSSQAFSAMLGDADTAMCVAKRDGGQQVRIHDQPLDSRWVHRKALADSLPAAIEANELYLKFQPIIALNSHYVVGFEALSRWDHPRFGVLSPGDFLPIAEETSLIHAVDSWVLDTAARQVSAWSTASQRPLDVWINLSARSLGRHDLADHVALLQRRHGVSIGVELTERDSFASSFHADRACSQLRAAGIKIALDDFGVGRSSLYRAVFHRPSVLKVDRSFVHGMLQSEQMMTMVDTILDLGRQLGIDVIAEGVENEAQMRQLEMMGCEFAQGYLFAPPLTAEIIEQRLGPRFDDLRVVKLSTAHQASHHFNV